jgi:pimeloyl-ACP methyl ester carboxylesterase
MFCALYSGKCLECLASSADNKVVINCFSGSFNSSYKGVNLLEHSVVFLDAVLKNLGLSKVTFLASSMVGLWVLNYALAHPEKVDLKQ